MSNLEQTLTESSWVAIHNRRNASHGRPQFLPMYENRISSLSHDIGSSTGPNEEEAIQASSYMEVIGFSGVALDAAVLKSPESSEILDLDIVDGVFKPYLTAEVNLDPISAIKKNVNYVEYEYKSVNLLRKTIESINQFSNLENWEIRDAISSLILNRLRQLNEYIGKGDQEQQEISLTSLKFFLDAVGRNEINVVPSITVTLDGEILAEWKQGAENRISILFRKIGEHFVFFNTGFHSGRVSVLHEVLGTSDCFLKFPVYLMENE